MRNIKQIIKNEYVWSVLTKVFFVLFSLINQVLLARYLGASLKGNVSYSQNLILMLETTLSFGLYSIYPLYRKRSANYSKTELDVFVSGTIVLYSFLLIFAGMCCFCGIINGIYRGVIIIAVLMAYADVQSITFLVEKPNKRNGIVLFSAVIELCIYIFVYIFISPSYFVGLILLFAMEIARGIVFTILLHPRLIISSNTIKVLFSNIKLGFFPMIALLLANLNYKLDIIMLSNCESVVACDVGIYSIAISIAEKTFLIPDSLKDILNSKLAKGADRTEVIRITRYGIWLAFFSAIGIIICCPIAIIFFGYEYYGAIPLIRLTVIFTVFMVLFKMLSTYNITNNKQIINTVFLTISVIVNFVLNYLMIPIYGAWGAGIATSFGFFSCGTMFAVYFCITEKENIYRFFVFDKSDISIIKKLVQRTIKKES